jgi:hypothetical protein
VIRLLLTTDLSIKKGLRSRPEKLRSFNLKQKLERHLETSRIILLRSRSDLSERCLSWRRVDLTREEQRVIEEVQELGLN